MPIKVSLGLIHSRRQTLNTIVARNITLIAGQPSHVIS